MRISIIDLETTGLNPQVDEILEIGLVQFYMGNENNIETWDTKVRPDLPSFISEEAKRVNGYNDKEWKDAASLSQSMLELKRRTNETILMSYNISFDNAFLQHAYMRTDMQDPIPHNRKFDVMTMAFLKLPDLGKWSLRNVCDALEIEREAEIHRALNGAMKAWEVYKKLAPHAQTL